MDPIQYPNFVHEDRKRWANKINREAWMFENTELPARGQLKLATLRRKTMR